jgi:hypothetical protein
MKRDSPSPYRKPSSMIDTIVQYLPALSDVFIPVGALSGNDGPLNPE